MATDSDTRSDSVGQESILNQPWEDVADDVTGAIEKAVQPLLKKATDDIYSGLLDATQDYLKDNLAFNIASRIDCAEREAASARKRAAVFASALERISISHLGDQPATAAGSELDWAKRHIAELRRIALNAIDEAGLA